MSPANVPDIVDCKTIWTYIKLKDIILSFNPAKYMKISPANVPDIVDCKMIWTYIKLKDIILTEVYDSMRLSNQ